VKQGNTKATCRQHTGNIKATYRQHKGNIKATYRHHKDNMWTTNVFPSGDVTEDKESRHTRVTMLLLCEKITLKCLEKFVLPTCLQHFFPSLADSFTLNPFQRNQKVQYVRP
jgi:hypothetical protein